MSAIRISDTVGQIVGQRPSRARVFERLGIDYCCGGKLTLEEAAAQQQLDPETVLAAIRESDAAAPADERDWTKAPLAELADHIEQTHHVYLRRELPRLTGLVTKIRQVHAERHPELIEVAQTFGGLRAELESHMRKEEMILFPIIRDMEATNEAGAAHRGSAQNPIRVMEMEHESAGNALSELRRLTNDYNAPADGCNSYAATLASLVELERDLHEHIHKENNVLFPRAVALEAECLVAAD